MGSPHLRQARIELDSKPFDSKKQRRNKFWKTYVSKANLLNSTRFGLALVYSMSCYSRCADRACAQGWLTRCVHVRACENIPSYPEDAVFKEETVTERSQDWICKLACCVGILLNHLEGGRQHGDAISKCTEPPWTLVGATIVNLETGVSV